MKARLLAVALLLGGLTTACAQPRAYGYRGFYAGPPPPPVAYSYRAPQFYAPQPGPGYVWIDGYWYLDGPGYVWRNGYWGRPPYRGAYWYAPRYRGGRWYPGYWRR